MPAPASGKIYEFNRLESGGMATAIQGCNMRTEYDTNASNDPPTTYGVYYAIHSGEQSIANIDTDTIFYSDFGTENAFVGQDEYYGIRESGSASSVNAEIVVKINDSGEVTEKYTCSLLGRFSVSGSIPYVDYYAGNFNMYKTGSADYTAIEGAVSQSCYDFGIVFSGSNFNDFISQSIPEGFDETVTGGIITDPSTEVSSSLQFQGYPHSGSVGSGVGE